MVAGVAGCKDRPRPTAAARDAGPRPTAAPIPGWPELAGLALAAPVWVVDLGPRAPRPERVAHPPVVVGDRVIIAGARLGYLGLDRGRGAIAWRRPASESLAAPRVLAADDVVLVHDCDEAVGAPPGHAVLACFDRIAPLAIAGRAAGRLYAAEAEVAGCLAGGGPWLVDGDDPAALTVGRGACRFVATLPDGRSRRVADVAPPPPPPDDVVAVDGAAVWRQVIGGGASRVVRDGGGPSLPGLTVLAAARAPGATAAGAVVVRADSSLGRDYLAAYDAAGVAWVWPLPAPPLDDGAAGGRGGPVAVAALAADVFVFYDASRVARFTAPWAAATAP